MDRNKKTVGCILTKAYPLHKGHMGLIESSAGKYDELYLMVCYSQGETIPIDMRTSWAIKATKHIKNIKVMNVLEQLGSSEDGRTSDKNVSATWAKWLIRKYPEITHFVGSEDYVRMMGESVGIEYDIYDIGREKIPMSATKIRSDFNGMKDNLAHEDIEKEYVYRVAIVGLDSCVDGDTEYFNGNEWKKISEYSEGEMVLQCNIDGSNAEMVKPQRYISAEQGNEKMYEFKTSGGNWSHVYSENHDVIVRTTRGKFKKVKCKELVKNHFENESGISYGFAPCFTKLNGQDSITPEKLRLLIAISADGSLSRQQWRVRLKKIDKIERMRKLIADVGLEVDERIYEDGYHNFYIPIEYGEKELPDYCYNMSHELNKVFYDEVFFWDGSFASDTPRYYSTIKKNADICQFVLASLGYRTGYYTDDRIGEIITEKEDKYKHNSICYSVSILKTSVLSFTLSKKNKQYRDQMVSEFTALDGKKYCFTVPSGCLVLRRNNQIFITGNCGKSTLAHWLGNDLECEIVNEYGRDYCALHTSPDDGVDNFITRRDLEEIAYGHHKLLIAAVRNAWKKGKRLVISDTEHIVTQGFSERYFGENNKRIQDMINFQHYDLYIYCNLLPLEDDGTRRIVSETERIENDKKLYKMFKDNVKDGQLVRVSDDWAERRLDSRDLINRIMGIIEQ